MKFIVQQGPLAHRIALYGYLAQKKKQKLEMQKDEIRVAIVMKSTCKNCCLRRVWVGAIVTKNDFVCVLLYFLE